MKRKVALLSYFVVAITAMLMFALPVTAEERDEYSYTISNGEIRIYRASPNLSGALTIPETINGYPVTKIGAHAFNGCTKLTSIQLPSSIVAIGPYAFMECSSLQSITIPDSVATMGDGVFKKCTALKSFVLSKGMTEIPLEAFSGCSSLEAVIIPENIRTVKSSAFYGCSSVKEIYVSKSVTAIRAGAFGNCISVEKITIPFVGESLSGDSYRVFGELFGGNNKYNVPQSLREIVMLGGNDIPKSAFEDCMYIEKIYISEFISDIGEKAFYNCPSLKEIVVDEKNSTYHSNGNCLIESATKRLILGCQTSTIPSDGTVTTIAGYAFGNCSNLKRIIVPNSVYKIELNAFYGCSSLEEISLPFVGEKASNTSYTHFGYIFGAHSIESHNAVLIPESLKKVTVTGNCSIGASAFSSCRNITSFTASSNIRTISAFAFSRCSALQTVRFEGTLETLGQSAFFNCTSLKEILLPASIKKIGNIVFQNCPLVKILCVEDSIAEQYAINNKLMYEIIEWPPEEVINPPHSPVPEPEKKEHSSLLPIGVVIIVAIIVTGAVVLCKKFCKKST